MARLMLEQDGPRRGASVRVCGTFDRDSIDEFEAALRRVAGPGSVVVDLRDVTFLDAAALGALLRVEARCRRRGLKLEVIEPDDTVAIPLRVSGVGEHLPIVNSRAAAG